MTELRSPASLLLGVAVGVGVCALLAWNPFGWTQIDRVLGRPGAMGEMDSVPVSPSAPEPPSDERRVLYWRAPMDPSYTSDQPGKSPMGMDLVPVYEEETAMEGGVRVSPNFLQNFGVRTTEVVRGALPHEIRTIGVLSHNEESVFSINTKFDGWIEKARVNNIGERVTQGDVLFEIYSPQLVATQQEYLAAMDYVARLSDNAAYPEAITRARSLLEATRSRLSYWDISQQQIDALEQSKKAGRTIQFISPYSGFIVQKMGDSLEGMKLSPGMTVLKLADHSKLWAEVEFYEDDIRHLRIGQRVTVEADAFPGRRWSGRILLFRPGINSQTRTLTALVEVANPDLRLLPQMYVNVSSRAGGVADALIVPEQAVLHSGERAVVIVASGGGRFEPREIRLGMASQGKQHVTDGLSAGEQVVTSSQFLIDSESNLRAAISQLLHDAPADPGAATPMPMDHER